LLITVLFSFDSVISRYTTLHYTTLYNTMSAEPMDVDPIDDGPKVVPQNPDGGTPAVASKVVISEEDEARQAIDLMRGDDVAGRVAAANRLEAVAAALGPQRTRDVSV
jgi:hypothetical protein